MDDDDDDLDDDFEISKLSDEEDEHGQPLGVEGDDENDSANPWRRTGGLRLTKNEYHRFCDAQLECKYIKFIHILKIVKKM